MIEGDVLDPSVYAAIDISAQKWGILPEGVADKITKLPNGDIDILALDEMVFAAMGSLALDPTPFEAAGWLSDVEGHGMNCSMTEPVHCLT